MEYLIKEMEDFTTTYEKACFVITGKIKLVGFMLQKTLSEIIYA